jgi:hypothetical protein
MYIAKGSVESTHKVPTSHVIVTPRPVLRVALCRRSFLRRSAKDQLRKRSSQPAPEQGGKMNNNVNSERAHLGVFSTASYINIGDPYGTKPKERDPRLLGKQFSMAVPKQGIAGARPNNSMFDREHKWLFNGEKCASRPCLAPGSSAGRQSAMASAQEPAARTRARLELLRLLAGAAGSACVGSCQRRSLSAHRRARGGCPATFGRALLSRVAATAHYRHPPMQVHRQNRVHPDEDQP